MRSSDKNKFSLPSPILQRHSPAFTLIEMLIIAPIIIILIGVMILAISSLTGDSLRSHERNTMTHQVQSALDLVELESSRSATYPDTTGTLSSPQGSNGSTAAFTTANNDSATNDVLIIKTPATTVNPINPDREVIYTNSPNSCSSGDVSKNAPYEIMTIYFVASGSLWQRTVMPSDNTPCSTPWQRASCATSQPLTGICKSHDNKLVDNVTSFSVQYLDDAGETIPSADPSEATAVNLTITASKQVAGETLTHTGTTRSVAMMGGSIPGGENTGGGGGTGATVTFDYTGSQQTWTVPAGVTSIEIEAWGAQGGSTSGSSYPGTGALGGYSKGTLSVTPGETLYVYVGGQGTSTTTKYGSYTLFSGGWNGGGSVSTQGNGGAGGGASDVRKGGQALTNRVIVAGGGGGVAWQNTQGGVGGGNSGGNGTTIDGAAAQGGTQTSGGAAGTAGTGGQTATAGALGQGGNGSGWSEGGGGGGGGYYGGGGGGYGNGGGGGSGYIGGITSGTTTAGQRSGNGQVIITPL